MNEYLQAFVERHRKEPVIQALSNYFTFNKKNKLSCQLVFLLNIVNDNSGDIENEVVKVELLLLISQFILYNQDNFLDWLYKKLMKDDKMEPEHVKQ